MAKGAQPGVWTIAWGVFWGLMLWTILTGTVAFILWAASCAVVVGGLSASGGSSPPTLTKAPAKSR